MVDTLSPSERLQLVNQFRILGILDPSNATRYSTNADILAHGYTIEYADVFSEIRDEIDVLTCRYVERVLEMYRALIGSFNALEDKQGLTLDDVRFKGFDANTESKSIAYTEHLKQKGSWPETLTGDVSRQGQMPYVPMLVKWEPYRQQIALNYPDSWPMNLDKIREIIYADYQ